nr:PREDICTED: pre-mRNA 3'-end-processing factor FIP1-like isoform X1 [Lepisosteus oculatus]
MATEVGTSAPSSIAHPGVEPEEDEEHWLYGDENSEKQPGDPAPGFPDSTQESHVSSSEDKDTADQVAQSGEDEDEEDSDSDSDEDDVKVTIGNIKTGAPSYMATPMNLSLKTGRGYGAAATAKLQPKGVDLEATGNINGLPALEADPDSFEDKPWRKPGADLSDYFNYGFNEDTWKAYCEKQRRLQLGLDPAGPAATENKITVQQGRMPVLEKDVDLAAIKPEFKADFPPTPVPLPPGRVKAGPPPNRKLGGTIDVIGGQTGAIRRVEGRRREKHASDENPIQVLGDHGNKSQAFAPQAGPPPPPIGAPPPHFLHPPPPVTSVPPPLHPPGIPPPAIPGLFPPPMAPPPALLMPPLDGCPTSAYGSRPPPPFGYSSGVLLVIQAAFLLQLRQLPSHLDLAHALGHLGGEGQQWRGQRGTLGVPGLSERPGAGARSDPHHQRVQQRGRALPLLQPRAELRVRAGVPPRPGAQPRAGGAAPRAPAPRQGGREQAQVLPPETARRRGGREPPQTQAQEEQAQQRGQGGRRGRGGGRGGARQQGAVTSCRGHAPSSTLRAFPQSTALPPSARRARPCGTSSLPASWALEGVGRLVSQPSSPRVSARASVHCREVGWAGLLLMKT